MVDDHLEKISFTVEGKGREIEAAIYLVVITEDEAAFRTKDVRRRLRRTRRGRAYLDYVFTPNPAVYHVPDETLVCRCGCVAPL